MSGEYHLSQKEKDDKAKQLKKERQIEKREAKIEEKNKVYEAPTERKRDKKASDKGSKPDIQDLKNKFLKKKWWIN